MALDVKHSRGANLAFSQNKSDRVKMASDFKIVHSTGTFEVITRTVTEFGPAIENHLSTAPKGWSEFHVDRVFKYLCDYALPVVYIGVDGVRDRSAFVIEVAMDCHLISHLKLGGIYTRDFCQGINSKNSGEEIVLDGNGIRRMRNHCSCVDGVPIRQTRPDT